MSRRIRQHVNPLALKFAVPRANFVNRPSHLPANCEVDVELGCADGQFSFDLAQTHPDRFVVGLDIREPVIVANNEVVDRLGITNLRFAYVNLNVDLDRVFAPNSVDRFHLLFPDPWFKQRHQKRRVVEPELLRTIHRQLRPGGELHFASDVFDIALEAMFELELPLAQHLGFRNKLDSWAFWRGNPFPAASRREDTTRRRNQRVWRIRYGLASTEGNANASSS